MRLRSLLSAVMLFTAVSSFAQQEYTITPTRGPVAGGTEVTVKGQFGDWSYGVIFGNTAVPATRVDATTLRATTPAHIPGTFPITIFEYDIGRSTNATFTFEGDASVAFERLLLPVFTPPIQGAFGSEFRTELTATLAREASAELIGLRYRCPFGPGECTVGEDESLYLSTFHPDLPEYEWTGTPGAFVYLTKEEANRVAMNLRAYDTSRSADNFGTEIPVVRSGEFAKEYDAITLVGIPSDPRFRNTLRIYSYGLFGARLIVTMQSEHGGKTETQVDLPPMQDNLHPGYLELTNFPVSVGMMKVRIDVVVPPISAPLPPPDRWAFVSVTNNVSQHITLVTPQ